MLTKEDRDAIRAHYERMKVTEAALRSRVPIHTLGSLDRYVEDRLPPGHFLTGVLSNDLTEACMRADNLNQTHLYDIVSYIYSGVPSICWGTSEKVRKWLNGEDPEEEA